jgi:uncharacterized protein (DUF885 family)
MQAANYDNTKGQQPNKMPTSNKKQPMTKQEIIQLINEDENFTREEKDNLLKEFNETTRWTRAHFPSKLQKLIEEKKQGKTGGYKKRRGKTLRKKKNRRKTKRIRWR